jgi:hypothetical protein
MPIRPKNIEKMSLDIQTEKHYLIEKKIFFFFFYIGPPFLVSVLMVRRYIYISLFVLQKRGGSDV